MRYQVPQFIEVEDKIVGPLTLKQALYVGGGVAIAFIIWSFLGMFAAIILGIPILALFLGLAFYKVNNKPLVFILESAVKYFFSERLYIWKKEQKKPKKGNREEAPKQEVFVPKLSDSKLREITWGLDINEELVNAQMSKQQNKE